MEASAGPKHWNTAFGRREQQQWLLGKMRKLLLPISVNRKRKARDREWKHHSKIIAAATFWPKRHMSHPLGTSGTILKHLPMLGFSRNEWGLRVINTDSCLLFWSYFSFQGFVISKIQVTYINSLKYTQQMHFWKVCYNLLYIEHVIFTLFKSAVHIFQFICFLGI